MDYEKLHKETIAKLQEMVNSGKITVEVARGICADFIPESDDERTRKEIIAEVKEQIDCIPAPDCRDEEDEKALKQLNKWLAWLERQGEQNSAWSEEDEKMVNYITIDIEELIEQNAYDETQLRKEIDWLKSLRPHFCDYHEGFKKGFAKAREMHYDHWKPSKEQISVVARLRHCLLEDVRGNDVVILDNLLEQLKAL